MHYFVISSRGINFDTTAKMLNFCKSMDELKLTCQICDLHWKVLGGNWNGRILIHTETEKGLTVDSEPIAKRQG